MHVHTKNTCFRLVGCPKWWEDNHKVKENLGTGKTTTAVVKNSKDTNVEQWEEESFGGMGTKRKDGSSSEGKGFGKLCLNPYSFNVNSLKLLNHAPNYLSNAHSTYQTSKNNK